jgi:methyl-accepting chemotaxis protein
MGSSASASSRAPSPGTFTAGPASHRGQRRLRNFLLDRHFQLKYSGYLVAIALFFSLFLGLILWQTSQQLMAQSRSSMVLGEEIVERGRNLLTESEKVNAVVRMSMVEAYADDPDLLEVFQGDSAKRDELLAEGQKQLENNSKTLAQKAQMIERQYVVFGFAIVSGLLLLVLGVGLAGVVVTHKVAGPVFKMKRLLGELAKGHFRVVARLRKGDELKEFFDAFNLAAEQLRLRQEDEIARIDGVLDLLRDAEGEDAGPVAGARQRLQSLRDSMLVPPTTRPPGA